jgi:hypothetical protein
LLADKETKIGVSPAFVNFDIDDPDGSADSFAGFQGLSITTIHNFNNKQRLLAVLNYYDFDVDASTSDIGQEVKGYQLGTYIQQKMRVSRALNFYAGLGLAYSSIEFKNRHTLDHDGYLRERFDDRKEGFLSLMANVSKEWAITEKFDLGTDLSFQYGIGDVFSGLKLSLNLLYKF